MLVPLEIEAHKIAAATLIKAPPGYRMLTLMDLLTFLCANWNEVYDATRWSVGDLNLVYHNVFAVSEHTKVRDVIRSTMKYSLSVVPVVAADSADDSAWGVIFQPVRDRDLFLYVNGFSCIVLER